MSKPIFDSRDPACKTPFGAVPAGTAVTFQVHLPKHLPVGQVRLRVFPIDFWEQSVLVDMQLTASNPTCNTYRCAYTPAEPAILQYHFELQAADYFTHIMRGDDGLGYACEGGLWQLTVYSNTMQTPASLREGVLYQIFPDRFRGSGTLKQDVPQDRLLRTDLDGLPHWRPNGQGEVTNSDYFGGDLAGITEKLDAIKYLGVTAIYLNPIFEAHSNHRYNTADYKKVDPLLGTNEDFRQLCAEAKKRGIGIILDGVFSHTGSDSVYFNREKRYGKGGAFNDPRSPYLPWYRFYEYPYHYESWWGFPTLPNVNEADPSYLEFICGQDGVLRHWLRLGASGFRLDVADELPDEFLDRLRACVKEENPDAVIIGEVWEDASNKVSYGNRRRYLLGGQLDSVMNYPFKDSLLRYIRYGGGWDFFNTVMSILENYPPPVTAALMNSLSTHDTARAITMLGGVPLGDQGRDWQELHHYLTPGQYAKGKERLTLAMVLQFGLPGIPCIYYGDEAGMAGYKDPFNRCCYPWGKEDNALVDTVRKLGAVRSRYAFSEAAFRPVVFDDNLCAFTREVAGATLLFAVNRSEEARPLPLPFPGTPQALFQYGQYQQDLLGPMSGIILAFGEK